MYPEALSVVLVSASPAIIDLVRNACANGASSAIQFAAAADAGAAQQYISDLDGVVVVLDCEGSAPTAEYLRQFVSEDAVAPVIVLTRDFSPDVELEMMQAGAAEVLPATQLNYGTLRRALRYALDRHAMRRKLARLTPFDPVSGLMTQSMFWEILGLAVRRGQRNRDFFSVLLIDFDWSDLPSDIADQAVPMLFKRFAERIKAVMRASDTVAKFDKSQIVVLAESMPRVEDVQVVAAKILSDITAPSAYRDRYVTVKAAIGIAIYPTSGTTPEDLMVRAGDALATSMERSTNRFAFG
ncbi:GGDEF domain-containing protein [Dongia deserti]|uniref:GGDEF domain-containing protein n=1 Tax=Dongia deserti TaxID=2268030 RepID=UPI000E65184B|nr:GGDEF domain-containing protein [Dongia deserti]